LYVPCFSQSENKEMLLNQNVKELMNSNPEQAINITKLLLSKPSITAGETAKINYLTAKIYRVKGDYSNALQFLFEEKKFADYLSNEEKLTIELEKVEVLRELSLDKEAKDILNAAESGNDPKGDADFKTFKDAAILLERVAFLNKDLKFKEGAEMLQNQLQISNNLIKFPELKLSYDIALGQQYLENRNLESAKKSFNSAFDKINKTTNNYQKIAILSGLANIYFQEKKHNEAISALTMAYNYAIGLQNTYIQEKLLNELLINYLAVGDTLNYKLNNVKLIQKYAEIEALDQAAVNTAYNLISEEQSENYVQQKASYNNIIIAFIVLAFLVVCVLLFFWWGLFQKKKRLKEIIYYLNISRNNFINKIPVKVVEESKKVNIPKETEQLILKKLERFENSTRFTNKDFSLAVLAGQFDTNTKYLSEVINSNFNMNFNTYVNNLRIKYIVEKLKNEPNYISYKISYLAEDCGFSSHSSFTTVFKSLTGISPVTYIEMLRKEKEEENIPMEEALEYE